jgi:hypothetical protein
MNVDWSHAPRTGRLLNSCSSFSADQMRSNVSMRFFQCAHCGRWRPSDKVGLEFQHRLILSVDLAPGKEQAFGQASCACNHLAVQVPPG